MKIMLSMFHVFKVSWVTSVSWVAYINLFNKYITVCWKKWLTSGPRTYSGCSVPVVMWWQFGHLATSMYWHRMQHPRVIWWPFATFPGGFQQTKSNGEEGDLLNNHRIRLMTTVNKTVKLAVTHWMTALLSD